MPSFAEWAARSDTLKIYLVELSAVKVTDLSTVALYLANHPYATAGGGSKFFVPCVSGLPRLTRQSNDTLDPNHVPSWGELEILVEPDYRPDAGRTVSWNTLLSPDYNFLGQPLTIKVGGEDFAYADFQTVFSGRIGGVSWKDNLATFTIYDKARDLAKKIPDYELPESPRVIEGSWDQAVPIVLGSVRNYKPVLINTGLPGSYPYKYALAAHVLHAVDAVYFNGLEYYSPAHWIWTQQDVSPSRKDGDGSAIMDTYGPYTGAALEVNWLVQIDSVTGGTEVGQATFRWSMDGGATWAGEGLLTWNLGYDPDSLEKTVSIGQATIEVSGTFADTQKLIYQVKISREGNIGGATPPQFIWSDDGGATWSDPIDIEDGDPISLSHGMSAAFASAGGVIGAVTNDYSEGRPLPGGTMATSGAYSGDATKTYEIVIAVAGDIGVATFQWRDGGDWSDPILTSETPILLSNGVYVEFHGVGAGYDDFYAGDAFSFNCYPQFCEEETWTWTEKEIPIPLDDGVSVQFIGQDGQDFYLWDEWEFILMSTLSLPAVGETTDVTLDARGLISPATGAHAGTIGEIIRSLGVIFAGWDQDDDFDTGALAAFDAAIPYQVGLVVDSPTEISQIFDDILEGIPAIYSITLAGKFFIAEQTAPTGDPVIELTDVEIIEPPEGAIDHEHLYRRVYVHYDRNWNTNQSASGVSQERLEWLRREWRQVSARDEDVLLTYPWAQDLGPLDTALIQRDEAIDLADKLLGLYKERRENLTVVTKIAPFTLGLWDMVTLKRNKFSLDAGELFAVVGLELDFSAAEATITLWR
jgi:hypothetical protein